MAAQLNRHACECRWHGHERQLAQIAAAWGVFLVLLYAPELIAAFRGAV